MPNTAKLTKRSVEAAAPQSGRRTVLWDSDMKGFGVRITRTGRTYFLRYRTGAGGRSAKQVDFTIGKHGAPWTVDQARQEARRLLGEVAAGRDPQADKIAARSRDKDSRFAAVAHLFLDRHVDRHLRPATRRDYRAIIERTLVPVWGEREIGAIRRADVIALVDDKAQTAPVMARLVFAVTRKLFSYAVERDLIESSPCDGMKGPSLPKARDRILNDEEIRLFWSAAQALGHPFGTAFRFLLLTGQRRTEVSALQWSELELAESVWTIPAARTKNGKAHAVDLGPSASEIVTAQKVLGPYVFGALGQRPLQGWSRAKRKLDALIAEKAASAGLPQLEPWRIHDLRRTAASGMSGLGFGPHVVERVLNHMSGSQGGLVGVYQRHELREQRRAALLAWERYVEALANPSNDPRVVPLKTAADLPWISH